MQPVVNPKGHDQQSDAELPDTEGSRPLKAPAKKTAARKSTAKPKPAAKRSAAKAKKPAKIAKPVKARKAVKKPVKLARKPVKAVKKTAKAAKKPVKVSKPVKAVKKTTKITKPVTTVKKPAKVAKPVKAVKKPATVAQPVMVALKKPANVAKPVSIENTGLLRTIMDQLDDAKAEAIVTISLNGKAALADAMVVASGRSNRHVGAIADQLVEKLKAAGHKNLRIEGMPQCDWVLVDAGDVVVHLFRPEVRSFYNLEKLWSEHAPEDRTAH